MGVIETRLAKKGIRSPEAAAPQGAYVPAVRVGTLLFLSGTLCVEKGRLTHEGKVGETQTVETAYQGARICALQVLATIQAVCGSLDKVKQIVSVTGFVNAIPGFSESPQVINGASELFIDVWGDRGRHTRAAVAVTGLPKNATVELQVIVALSDE